MNIIEVIGQVSNFFTGLGVSLLLPIIITILGLVFGQKFSKALRAGLTLGAGFIALNLVIGLLIGQMVPVVNVMVENTGSNLDIFDVGWGVAGAIAWGTKAGSLVIFVCLLTNIKVFQTSFINFFLQKFC